VDKFIKSVSFTKKQMYLTEMCFPMKSKYYDELRVFLTTSLLEINNLVIRKIRSYHG
jgi:hypothetical protein